MSSGSRAHALELRLLLEQLLDRERDVALQEARAVDEQRTADRAGDGRDDRQRGALAVRVGERTGDQAAEEAAHEEDEHRDERERLGAHSVRRDRADDRPDAHERGTRARIGERDAGEEQRRLLHHEVEDLGLVADLEVLGVAEVVAVDLVRERAVAGRP